jgi:hypothetical protein
MIVRCNFNIIKLRKSGFEKLIETKTFHEFVTNSKTDMNNNSTRKIES